MYTISCIKNRRKLTCVEQLKVRILKRNLPAAAWRTQQLNDRIQVLLSHWFTPWKAPHHFVRKYVKIRIKGALMRTL